MQSCFLLSDFSQLKCAQWPGIDSVPLLRGGARPPPRVRGHCRWPRLVGKERSPLRAYLEQVRERWDEVNAGILGGDDGCSCYVSSSLGSRADELSLWKVYLGSAQGGPGGRGGVRTQFLRQREDALTPWKLGGWDPSQYCPEMGWWAGGLMPLRGCGWPWETRVTLDVGSYSGEADPKPPGAEVRFQQHFRKLSLCPSTLNETWVDVRWDISGWVFPEWLTFLWWDSCMCTCVRISVRRCVSAQVWAHVYAILRPMRMHENVRLSYIPVLSTCVYNYVCIEICVWVHLCDYNCVSIRECMWLECVDVRNCGSVGGCVSGGE